MELSVWLDLQVKMEPLELSVYPGLWDLLAKTEKEDWMELRVTLASLGQMARGV